MAENPLGIGGAGTGAVDALKEALGLDTPRVTRRGGLSSGTSTRQSPFGARGQRMLPADFPEERLDHGAARGTYLDILV